MSLSSWIPRIFNHAWKRYGKPKVAAVRPIAQWSLPVGFAYDDDMDVASNAAGAVITNPEDYWAMDYIYIVPVQRSADMQMLIAAGEAPSGTAEFYILEDDAATVRAAFAIEFDGDWYDVQEVAHAPLGLGQSGRWARVRVSRRS